MMNPNKISIIIPVYNTEKYLDKCLLSLKNQTFKNIEILCVNDGSKDKSAEILEKYEKLDPRFKIYHQTNSGPAKARNLGLAKATGNYIMFCDSDDWYEAQMCEVMLNTIISQGTDLAICNSYYHNIDSLDFRDIKTIEKTHLKHQLGKVDLNDTNRISVFLVLWNKIFIKEIIDKHDITFPNGYEFDDDSFVYQYLAAAKSYYAIEDKLYNYVIRANSIMSNLKINAKYHDASMSLKHTVNSFKKNNFLDQQNFIYHIICRKIDWVLSGIEKKLELTFLKEIQTEVISLLPDDIIQRYKVFHYLKAGQFEKYKKSSKQTAATSEVRALGITFFRVTQDINKKKYYLMGLQVFKITTLQNIIETYILGIRVSKKNIS